MNSLKNVIQKGFSVPGKCLYWLPVLLFTLLAGNVVSAAEPADSGGANQDVIFWGICFLGAMTALVQAYLFFRSMMASDEGNDRMIELAGHVRNGAQAYLTQQYKVVLILFVIIFVFLSFAAFILKVQSEYVPFAFVTGGLFSGLAGFFGVKTATWASSRTAAGAQHSLNEGLRVAFRSGAVMGLTVVGLGLLDIMIWYAILKWVFDLSLSQLSVTMLCFGTVSYTHLTLPTKA